jgi:NAD-dependent deacetylase
MKKLVVLTGAGISAESGLRTFREMGGLWEEHDVMDVASYDGWLRNPTLVLNFYNDRRRQLASAQPNAGHLGLVELEKTFEVTVITQNVDNLHERAGSTHVIHLHGELTKARSTADPELVYEIGTKDILPGDKCEKGSQLRPHIVWFGEPVPAIAEAAEMASKADVFVVVGTSLNVYPAAGLIDYAPSNCPIYLVDPHPVATGNRRHIEVIPEKASIGVPLLIEKLKNQ